MKGNLRAVEVKWAFSPSFYSEYRIRSLASADVADIMLIEIFSPDD